MALFIHQVCKSLSSLATTVNTSNPSFSCAVAYAVTSDYTTFDDIAGIVLKTKANNVPSMSASDLRALNPATACSVDPSQPNMQGGGACVSPLVPVVVVQSGRLKICTMDFENLHHGL